MKVNQNLRVLFLIQLLLCPCIMLAQSMQQIEKELNNSLRRMEEFAYLSQRTDETAYDSLLMENVILEEKLIKYATQNPEMLNYEFPMLKSEYFYVATSTDRKFRIFSWDMRTGGNMHFFDNVFVYEDNKKIYASSPTLPEGSPGGYYSDIYLVKDARNSFYLGYLHQIFSSRDQYQAFQIIDFDKDSLQQNISKFFTKTGFSSSLGFPFNFFTVGDKKERPLRLITYNAAQKIISIPVVSENGDVGKKRISYQFNGTYFTRQITQ